MTGEPVLKLYSFQENTEIFTNLTMLLRVMIMGKVSRFTCMISSEEEDTVSENMGKAYKEQAGAELCQTQHS